MAVSRSIKISGKEGTIWSHSSFIFATLVFMVITLVYVWSHINITELNYKIAGEIRVGDRLSEENEKLKLEMAHLKSPGRIEAIARDKLKMQYPDREQIIYLK